MKYMCTYRYVYLCVCIFHFILKIVLKYFIQIILLTAGWNEMSVPGTITMLGPFI